MTEQQAIKAIQNDLEWHSKELKPAYKEVLRMAIQALEEIQAYRAIGTMEGYKRALEISKENFRLGMEYKAKVQEYEAIGTIEEFKALKDCGTHDCIIKHLTRECSYNETGCSDCKSIEMIRTAVERMKPKKVLYRKQHYGTPWLCPECEADQIKVEFFNTDGSEPQEKHTFCWKCGTVIDWSE